MDNNNDNKSEKSEIIKNATFIDLIVFKEELLKLMKDMKSEVNNKLTSEFQKFKNIMNNNQTKFSSIESLYLSKLNFIEEREKILTKIKNTEEEFEKSIIKQNIIVDNCNKDLRKACFKYDKIIMDNLYIPSLIGQACQFPNLKEYILSNKDDLDNCISFIKQKEIDLKLFKTKVDESIIKFNFQTKMTLDNNTELIKIKIDDFEKKFYDNLNEFRSIIKNMSLNINLNSSKIKEQEIKNDEKIEILNNLQKNYEKSEKNISNLFLNINSMKNEIENIKRNIIEILSLLSKNNSTNNIQENYEIIGNIKNQNNLVNNNYILEQSKENNYNNNSYENIKYDINKYKYNLFEKDQKIVEDKINGININNFENKDNINLDINKKFKNMFSPIKKNSELLDNINKQIKSLVILDNLKNKENLNSDNSIINKNIDLEKNELNSSEINKSYNSNDKANVKDIENENNKNNNILIMNNKNKPNNENIISRIKNKSQFFYRKNENNNYNNSFSKKKIVKKIKK